MKIKFMALLLAAVASCQARSATPDTALDQLEEYLRSGTGQVTGLTLSVDSYERVEDALVLKDVHMVSPDGVELSAADGTLTADGDGWRLTLVDVETLSANGDTTNSTEMHVSWMGSDQ